MKRMIVLGIFVCVMVLLNLAAPAYAAKHALVIGNGGYRGGLALPTPVNDANAMASSLRGLGFSVMKKTDLGHQAMEDVIREFGTRLGKGDTGLFYFSGHGLQTKGVNYLIPVRSGIRSRNDIKFKSVAAELVLGEMESSGSGVNIIILDACRNNPFKGFKSMGQGLAPMIGPQGTFIAYATAPGTKAWTGSENESIYTKYLVRAMNTPGLKIEDVFKKVRVGVLSETSGEQVPWDSSSLTENFYFAGRSVVVDESTGRDFTNNISMKFVYIQPGSFMMGSPESEPERRSNEKQHRVRITKGFYMQTTEVTQGQWQAVMGSNPSKFKNCGNDCPVENVSWDDVQEFVRKLNRTEGTGKYRLPTEAEWEYAARAGTSTAYSWGDRADCSKMMYENDVGSSENKCVDYVRRKGLTPDSTAPVMSYASNFWGLYDMHGNVWEWCRDWFGDYPSSSVADPRGSSIGSDRVFRGGCWSSVAGYCRSAVRCSYSPGFRYDGLGFRLALSPGQ